MDILCLDTVYALLRHPDLVVAEEAARELARRGLTADEAWTQFYAARRAV